MKILSERNMILWINSIGLRAPSLNSQDVARILSKMKSLFSGIERVNGNLYVLTPLAIPLHKYPWVRKLNRELLLAQIRYYMKKLKIVDVDLWTFMPTMANLVGRLRERKLIYYCVDDWSKFSFIESQSMAQLEADLVKRCDVVITSARELYEQKKKLNPNTHLILHGVDYGHFSKALGQDCSIPEDIRDIAKPIIGFFGLIHEWIDLSLIDRVGKVHPDWSIVLIGKVSVDVSELKKLRNVHFLGQKKYGDLPGYCRAFDVAMIPFVINELTKSVNPIKLREYLAAGLPVVSVDLPEIRAYETTVRISRNHEEFIRNIELALINLQEEEKKERSAWMKREDWNFKVLEISKLLS
jgi:glycosyltransferase involved in cell wall biosynthesis